MKIYRFSIGQDKEKTYPQKKAYLPCLFAEPIRTITDYVYQKAPVFHAQILCPQNNKNIFTYQTKAAQTFCLPLSDRLLRLFRQAPEEASKLSRVYWQGIRRNLPRHKEQTLYSVEVNR
ncbi:hypothetical protein [Mediterranea sp. An20]|uniref:hypothetical protein n=1 Tax=Mediterranea sp. An20 TaxID=1965586 RepID=UPI0013A64686|nr:hypothetical protein [Mediterranea sp. An20]